MEKLLFFFDFLSPFSYFAWKNLPKTLPKADIEYLPVAMGKLFSHHGFPGPGEIPAKRAYELKKCFRYAGDNNIDFRPPTQFPFNPLAILRAATFAAAGPHQKVVIDKVFSEVWGKGEVLEDPEKVEMLVNSIDRSIFEKSFEKGSRMELKQNIKRAIEYDVFGVPSLIYQDEVFWGNDSLITLQNVITGNDNWDREYYDSLMGK